MMLKEKFDIILSLVAGLVMTVACVYYREPLMQMALKVLGAMLAFLVIGVIIKWVVIQKAFPEPVAAEEEDEMQDEAADENSDE